MEPIFQSIAHHGGGLLVALAIGLLFGLWCGLARHRERWTQLLLELGKELPAALRQTLPEVDWRRLPDSEELASWRKHLASDVEGARELERAAATHETSLSLRTVEQEQVRYALAERSREVEQIGRRLVTAEASRGFLDERARELAAIGQKKDDLILDLERKRAAAEAARSDQERALVAERTVLQETRDELHRALREREDAQQTLRWRAAELTRLEQTLQLGRRDLAALQERQAEGPSSIARERERALAAAQAEREQEARLIGELDVTVEARREELASAQGALAQAQQVARWRAAEAARMQEAEPLTRHTLASCRERLAEGARQSATAHLEQESRHAAAEVARASEVDAVASLRETLASRREALAQQSSALEQTRETVRWRSAEAARLEEAEQLTRQSVARRRELTDDQARQARDAVIEREQSLATVEAERAREVEAVSELRSALGARREELAREISALEEARQAARWRAAAAARLQEEEPQARQSLALRTQRLAEDGSRLAAAMVERERSLAAAEALRTREVEAVARLSAAHTRQQDELLRDQRALQGARQAAHAHADQAVRLHELEQTSRHAVGILRDRLHEMVPESERLQAELGSQLAIAETGAGEQERMLEQLRARLQDRTATLAHQRQAEAEARASGLARRAELERLRHLDGLRERLEQEGEAGRALTAELERRLAEALASRDQETAALDASRAAHQQLREALADVAARDQDQRQLIRLRQAEAARLRELEAELRAADASARRELSALRQRSERGAADLARVAAERDALVAADRELAARYLAASQALQTTSSAVEEHVQEFDQLASERTLAGPRQIEAKRRLEALATRRSELEQQEIESGAKLASVERAGTELDANERALDAEVGQAGARLARAERDRAALEQERSSLLAKLELLEESVRGEASDLRRKGDQVVELQARLDSARRVQGERLARLEQDLVELRERHDRAHDQGRQSRGQEVQLQHEIERLRRERRNGSPARVQQLREELEARRRQATALADQAKERRRELAAARRRQAAGEQLERDGSARLQALETLASESSHAAARNADRLATLHAQIEKIEAEAQRQRGRATALERNLSGAPPGGENGPGAPAPRREGEHA